MSPARLEQVTKRYRGITALDRVSMEAPENAILALVGPSGAGKTTALQILMNIQRPTGGRTEVLGVDSRRLGPQHYRLIGYVSENQDCPEWMTVKGFLAYCREFYPEWSDEEADALLRQFDLPPERKLSDLSRGMRMKAVLASSLAYRPRLLVLDEPFSGLDVRVREQLTEGILERAESMTVIIASHDLGELETFISHIAYLEHGVLHFVEELSDLANRFREVEVVCEGPASGSVKWPEHWLRAESGGAVARFTDSRYDPRLLDARVRDYFSGVRQVNVRNIDLRGIFLALASREGEK